MAIYRLQSAYLPQGWIRDVLVTVSAEGIITAIDAGAAAEPQRTPEAAIELYPLGSKISACPSDVLIRASAGLGVGWFEEHFSGFRQLYEDMGFFAKLYLVEKVYFSTNVWLKYRQHPNSISEAVRVSGKYREVRVYFLNWLEKYLAAQPQVDRRIGAALRRALRPHRRPRSHVALTRLQGVLGRIRGLIGRMIGQQASP